LNAPFLWILCPLAVAAILLLLMRWNLGVSLAGTIIAALLAGLAWFLPLEDQISLGPVGFGFSDTWSVLGRNFILGAAQRPALVVIYLAAAFWFGAGPIAKANRNFVPLGLAITALLAAIVAVEPFLYAALLIETAVLVSIPMLVPVSQPAGRGVLRYLTYLTMGMPFILYTGWMLTGADSGPGDPQLVVRSAVLLGLGFALLLGVIPFHTWIPMLMQESHPYTVAYVLLILTSAISFFGLSFFNRFAWLREIEGLYPLLRFSGVLMVVTAGLWAAFQRRLDRMLGFAVIFEVGVSLLTISLAQGAATDTFVGIFFAGLLPRGLSLGVWALALIILGGQAEQLDYLHVQGLARRLPLAAAGLILAQFSIAGLPLLAGFPLRLRIWEQLAQISPSIAFWSLIGAFGFLLGGLRTLAVLVMGPEEAWGWSESWLQRAYLGLGILALLLVGLFPQWFLPIVANLPQVFERLAP